MTKSTFTDTIIYDLFLKVKMKNKTWKNKAKLYNQFNKVKKRRVEKFMSTRNYTNHTLIHLGEIIIVWAIWAFTILHASYDNSYEHLYRESSVEISRAFTDAIEQQRPTQSKIISIWNETRKNIENTFFPGYCTWWAALTSPEFFPFIDNSIQQRTRWWNAVDRCSWANATWFQIGSNPSVWSLIVYKWTSSNWYFWHVWKVMYYNNKNESMIIRDMNWISKYTWTDRREDKKNNNIKCYIYPNKKNNNESNQNNNDWSNQEINNNTNNTTNPNNNLNQNNKANTNTEKKPENTTQSPTTDNTIDQTHNSAPTNPTIEQEPEKNNFDNEINLTKEDNFIIEKNQNFSDITNHFISQNEIKINVIKNKKINIWDTIKLQITIVNKITKENYFWILPFVLNIIPQNILLESSLKTMQFIHEKENIITFKSKEKWETSFVITIDDHKIITIPVFIN